MKKIFDVNGPGEICYNEPDMLEAQVPLIRATAIARKLEK